MCRSLFAWIPKNRKNHKKNPNSSKFILCFIQGKKTCSNIWLIVFVFCFCVCFQPDEITLLQFGLGPPQNSQINDGSQQQQNANSQNSPVYRESRGLSTSTSHSLCFALFNFYHFFFVFFFSLPLTGRSVGVGPMRRPGDRKIDTSPYSSGNVAYLSPPNEWRRTSSDSAIHQSLSQNQVSAPHVFRYRYRWCLFVCE